MADRKVQLTISAKDDASKVIDKVGKSLDKTGEAAESTAKLLAKGMAAGADKLEAELTATAKAADKLAAALGPELAGRVNVENLVHQFRQLGAEFDDIEANADDLAASVKRLDSVEGAARLRTGMDDVGTSVRRVGDETDRSRSVMANFMGNATQELPGVAGAMGPLNVAMGQFAEYATEGGIALSGLVAALAPIAASVVVFKGISHYMKGMHDFDAFNKKDVEEWTSALRGGKTELEHIRDLVSETGELKTPVFGMADLIPELHALGASAETYAQVLKMTDDQIAAFIKTATGQSATFSKNQFLYEALTNAAHNYQDAVKKAAKGNQFLGMTTEELNKVTADHIELQEGYLRSAREAVAAEESVLETVDRNRRGVESLAHAYEDSAQQARDHAAATRLAEQAERDAADAIRDATNAVNERFSAQLALANAEDNAAESVDAFNKAMMEGTAEEASDALRDAEGSLLALGAAAQAATGSTQGQVDALQEVADKLAPGSYLRKWLEDYIAQLRRVPGAVHTRFTAGAIVNGQEALVQGRRAAGGPVAAGGAYVVGENGPELLQMGSQGGNVVPNGALGGVHIDQIIIQSSGNPDYDGRRVIEAIKREERRVGTGWRS